MMGELLLMFEQAKMFLPITISFIVFLFLIHVVNAMFGNLLRVLGNIPREPIHLPGILFSPLLHGDMWHLIFNVIPLSVLMTFCLTFGLEVFTALTLAIVIAGGALVWCFARAGNHIGASGLVSGYYGWVIGVAWLAPSVATLVPSVCILYYFAGIFFGLFPDDEATSFESHLFGFTVGLYMSLNQGDWLPYWSGFLEEHSIDLSAFYGLFLEASL